MTDKNQRYVQLIKDAPLRLRVSLAAVWVGALGLVVLSFLSADWILVGLCMLIVGHVTTGAIISQRGLSPSGREKLVMWSGSLLILVLSAVIIMRRFVS